MTKQAHLDEYALQMILRGLEAANELKDQLAAVGLGFNPADRASSRRWPEGEAIAVVKEALKEIE